MNRASQSRKPPAKHGSVKRRSETQRIVAKRELTAEEEEQRRHYREMKWPEFDAKQQELRQAADSEMRYNTVVKAIHDYAEHDEWFAANTPHPFTTSYWSNIPGLAQVCCRYLREIARAGNKEAIRGLASLAINLTETLDELVADESSNSDQIVELLKWEAEELPYWPVLYFRNTAANNHLPRLADRIGLGKKCYLNVSETANFSLRTPINRFVWKCLRHFQKMHQIIGAGERETAGVDETLERYVFCEVSPPQAHRRFRAGMINREEIAIYAASCRLPSLTKDRTIAKRWADVAIMPYVKIRFPDLRSVPELHGIESGVSGRSYARLRKAVIQALEQLARKT